MGTVQTGTFSAVTWATGLKFMKVEFDPTGGTSYLLSGTQQILSVPYALNALNAKTYVAGAGISVSGSIITNTAPNQTVNLSATGISTVSGSYPNYTVNTPSNIAGNGISISGNTISANFNSFLPPGMITPYASTVIPAGWLSCDGAAVSRTTYVNLFLIIGTSYGSGDGSTTFNLPDFRGRFLRGVSGATNNDPDKTSRVALNSGGNIGNNIGSLQGESTGSHSHNLAILAGCFSGTSAGSSTSYLGGTGLWSAPPCGFFTNNTTSILSNGGSESRPSNVYVNYLIKF